MRLTERPAKFISAQPLLIRSTEGPRERFGALTNAGPLARSIFGLGTLRRRRFFNLWIRLTHK